MQIRKAKVSASAAGGTAGRGARTYKLALPSSWIAELGLDDENRTVNLIFDGERIIIEKPLKPEQFVLRKKAAGHEVRSFLFYDGDTLCTRIAADFTEHTLCAENCTDDPVKTAFGKNAVPSWDDLTGFLAERCIPAQRAGLREYLEAQGLAAYDELEIIRKTGGRMAEDAQWLEVVEE